MFPHSNAKTSSRWLQKTDSHHCFGSRQHLPLLKLETPLCSAIIAPQGAQLLQFTPKQTPQSTPWLWLPPDATFTPGEPVNGGIPLCLPWFGRHRNAEWPIHGYLRQQDWQLDSVQEQQQTVHLQFSYRHQASRYFPYAFDAIHHISLSDHIALSLELHNHDPQPVPFSWAWHSYFQVDDVPGTTLAGLDQQPFLDNLDNLQKRRQHGIIRFDQPIDAVFEQTQHAQQLSSGRQQRLIDGEHCPSCIVWQPGSAAGNFVCVERGGAFADRFILNRGERFCATMTIKEP